MSTDTDRQTELGMRSSEALSVSHVSKRYDIYARPADRLKQAVIPRLKHIIPQKFRRATPYYREFWALKNVSFSLHRGEALGLLGRNGAGKSTLLQIIAGTSTPTEGCVELTGRVAALLELGSGFSPEFTGRENVRLNASLLGLRPQEIDDKFEDICRFADIGDFINQPVKTYSSGMMLRLAFAVQTAVEPEVLIVDEALAVGDARFQKKCFSRLDQLRASGTTILLVTHDSGTIVQSCDRALILEKGEVFAIGEPRHITREYHKLLFGSPETANEKFKPVSRDSDLGSTGTSNADSTLAPGEDLRPSAVRASGEVRYGTGEVQILHVAIRDASGGETSIVETHTMCEAYFSGAFREAISGDLAYGFIISNAKGIEVYGTKSPFFSDWLKAGEPGSRFECRLQFCVRLVPGRYFLSAALARQEGRDDGQFLDFRFDALEFEVVGQSRAFTTSIVDLDARVSHSVWPPASVHHS